MGGYWRGVLEGGIGGGYWRAAGGHWRGVLEGAWGGGAKRAKYKVNCNPMMWDANVCDEYYRLREDTLFLKMKKTTESLFNSTGDTTNK